MDELHVRDSRRRFPGDTRDELYVREKLARWLRLFWRQFKPLLGFIVNMLLCKALNEQPRVHTSELFSPTCRFARRSWPENQFSLSCLVGWVRRLFAFLPARLPTHTNFSSTRESTPKEKNVRSVLEALITAEFVMDFSRTLPIQITHSGIIREITVQKRRKISLKGCVREFARLN